VFWVDLDNLDFSQGSDVVKLDLGVDTERVLSGEVSAAFKPAEPFAFQPADLAARRHNDGSGGNPR